MIPLDSGAAEQNISLASLFHPLLPIMKIKAETELMKNQKHAEVMAPGRVFDVLQTADGDALFFSIGTDNIFYVTREVHMSQTGWLRLDLSSQLSELHGGATVQAKSFALSQNPQTLHFDLALVVTINGTDALYLSAGHAADAQDWAQAIPWTSVPFDAAGIIPPKPLTIADVYLMSIPSHDGEPPTQNIFVDILQTPGNPLKLLDRYFINSDASTRWSRHALAADLKEGTISSCLGRRRDDRVPGIYTFGKIEDTRELIFRPQYNYFRPKVAPNSARLTLPLRATAISSAVNESGETNLFVASSEGLHVFTPDNQFDDAKPTLAVPTTMVGKVNLFDGVSLLVAETLKGRTVVWVLNAQGDMFYVACAAGSEADASAWNPPVPLYHNVRHFAFYLNGSRSSSNVLFAQIGGNELVQFTQDATTSEWTKRPIMLPTTDMNKYAEFTSFTSQVCITDDKGMGLPNVEALLTAPRPVSVYVDNKYCMLTPDVPIRATTDAAGALNIVQEVTSLAGIKVCVAVDGSVLEIDPSAKAMGKMANITKGSDLAGIMVTKSDGSERPLVPNDVSEDARNAAAKQLAQLVQLKSSVPDAAVTTWTNARATEFASVSAVDSRPILSGHGSISLINSAAHALAVASGDMFAWLQNAWDSVTDWAIHKVETGWQFVVEIGKVIYRTIIDCVSAAINAIELVWSSVKVFFEDLYNWLGALFNWKDIMRTHRVMKHVMKRRLQMAVDGLDDAMEFCDQTFINIEDMINSWADITDPGETIGTQMGKGQRSVAANSNPQTNWAIQHVKNGVKSSKTTATEPSAVSAGLEAVQDLITQLGHMMKEEEAHVETMITQLQEQIVDQYSSLTWAQVAKRLLGILGGFVVKSARNLLGKIIGVIKALMHGVLGMLDGALHIPVVSNLYRKITGNELTVLDLSVWVGAIPATIAYKLRWKRAPYPSDAMVDSIVNAHQSWKATTNAETAPSTNMTFATSIAPTDETWAGADAAATLAQNSNEKSHISEHEAMKRQAAAMQEEMKTWGPLDTLEACFDIVGFVGSLLYTVAWGFKCIWNAEHNAPEPPTWGLWFYGASYLLYMAPNFVVWKNSDSWPTILNHVLTGISVLKVLTECTPQGFINPIWGGRGSLLLECFISVIWLVPAIGMVVYSEKKASDWTMLAAKLCFIVRGTLSPGALSAKVGGKTILGQSILAVAYGSLCLATGVLLE
ncbi:hypothetical protein F5X97DRAFT_11942 [Nemania serpens]|nr:hypothetical protein F5X97DRAFT_11942 [Nemania serpens]